MNSLLRRELRRNEKEIDGSIVAINATWRDGAGVRANIIVFDGENGNMARAYFENGEVEFEKQHSASDKTSEIAPFITENKEAILELAESLID